MGIGSGLIRKHENAAGTLIFVFRCQRRLVEVCECITDRKTAARKVKTKDALAVVNAVGERWIGCEVAIPGGKKRPPVRGHGVDGKSGARPPDSVSVSIGRSTKFGCSLSVVSL